MRCIILFIVSLLISDFAYSQNNTFTCENIQNDWMHWLEINAKTKKTDFLTKAIMLYEDSVFKPHNNSIIERVYIIQSEDSFKIEKLKSVIFDYFTNQFNLDNEQRSQMVENSTDSHVFFKGTFTNLGSFANLGSISNIHAHILFDIGVKSNRLRISAKIEQYQIMTYSTLNNALIDNKIQSINSYFPFNTSSKHKGDYAMAFTRCTINTWKYMNSLFEFMNSHINIEKSSDDDW